MRETLEAVNKLIAKNVNYVVVIEFEGVNKLNHPIGLKLISFGDP